MIWKYHLGGQILYRSTNRVNVCILNSWLGSVQSADVPVEHTVPVLSLVWEPQLPVQEPHVDHCQNAQIKLHVSDSSLVHSPVATRVRVAIGALTVWHPSEHAPHSPQTRSSPVQVLPPSPPSSPPSDSPAQSISFTESEIPCFYQSFNRLPSAAIKCYIQDLDFWPKFRFSTKTLICCYNFYFWQTFLFLTKIFIFEQNLSFVAIIYIFGQHFDFRPQFWFLAKILIFNPNFDFCPKFKLLTKIYIFGQNLHFWPKFTSLAKICIFDQNSDFRP